MSTIYKIYALVLEDRLKDEIKVKGIIPHNQTGFRKGTIDNIYVLGLASS